MSVGTLLEPKEIIYTSNQSGKEVTILISKIPAIPAREIITQYVTSGLPKLGDYSRNEELMLKLMSYVAVKPGGDSAPLALNSHDIIHNHVPDWEVLAHIEKDMIEYNCSFFPQGGISGILEILTKEVTALISPILTDLLARSSVAVAPPSTSSEQSTH